MHGHELFKTVVPIRQVNTQTKVCDRPVQQITTS